MKMQMNRKRASELGRETVAIVEAGRYATETGQNVEIGPLVQHAVEGTKTYPPGCELPLPLSPDRTTEMQVANETTLVAARRLVDNGYKPAALNFASAKHPGGGFLSGARAQEESLARSSALFACLDGNEMYDFHRARKDPLYTDYAIYSPGVSVIRADDGTLLDEPWLCSFITCPAVNAKVVLERNPSRRGEIRDAMETRVTKVLAIAAIHGHEALVLGAWGCGVFGNDGRGIAELFQTALDGQFAGMFSRVIFAVTDWSPERRFIGPFEQVFGGSASA
jgi:uncharacterized protein (TIGR02452 family)